LAKNVVFVSNKKLELIYFIHVILIGHIKASNNMHSTVGLSIKEGFNTNYSAKDFDEHYVKPEEFQNYNRDCDFPDFVFKFSTEIQVMTNMAITANRTMSLCPEHSHISGILCRKNSSDCVKGLKRPHGIQTGRCVPSDFPYRDEHGVWTDVNVCQIKGNST
jgi:hypothetical protein